MAGLGVALMSVLLTGGAGYIGSHAAQRFLELGEDVLVFDNLSTGLRQGIPTGAQFIFGDVRDGALLGRVLKDHKISAVVHFAAKSVVPESVSSPLDYYENNVLGTLRVAEACHRAQVKDLIFSSSASVYGAPEQVPISEEAPTRPSNPYGESKLMGEKILKAMGVAHGMKHVSLRYFNVAGARRDLSNGQRTERASHLVKVAAEAAVGRRKSVEVFGQDYATHDGTGVRDYIHIEDLVEAHVLALKYLRQGGESVVLNCGYGRGFSVLEVLTSMKKVSQSQFEVQIKGPRPGDIGICFADSQRIRKLLGWVPNCNDLDLICQTAYQWEQSSMAGRSPENLK